MSDNGILIWLIATAIMIVTVLTVGTLAAAGTFEHERPEDDSERDGVDRDGAESDRRELSRT